MCCVLQTAFVGLIAHFYRVFEESATGCGVTTLADKEGFESDLKLPTASNPVSVSVPGFAPLVAVAPQQALVPASGVLTPATLFIALSLGGPSMCRAPVYLLLRQGQEHGCAEACLLIFRHSSGWWPCCTATWDSCFSPWISCVT